MKSVSWLLSASCLVLCLITGATRPKPTKLEKVWETDTTLRVPESVLFDGDKTLYVSNIAGKPDDLDGEGFISKVALNGTIENLRWTSGLNAPKGMGLHKRTLYVTDLYRLIAIDTETGQAGKVWDSVDGKNAFLNDVTVAKDGTVYVSDNRNDKIYRLKDNKWAVWITGGGINKPNGLLAVGNDKLLVGSTQTGALQLMDVASKKLTKLADGMGNTDGVTAVDKSSYLVSDWNGQIFYVSEGGQKTQLLDSRTEKMHTADIEYIPKARLLIVPTFFKNKLVAYRLK